MIRCVLFDFNGVVVKSVEFNVFRRVCRAYRVNRLLAIVRLFAYLPMLEMGRLDAYSYWQKVLAKDARAFTREDFEHFILSPYRKETPFYPGILKLVGRLKAQGVRCAVISNSNESQTRINRAQGRYDLFDAVYLSDEVGKMKPDPRFFQYALQDLGVSSHDCVFVDDHWVNLVPARLLGMNALYFHGEVRVIKGIERLLERH